MDMAVSSLLLLEVKELGGDGVAGLEAEGYGDIVGLAVVGFVEAVEHAVHSVALVTMLCGPLGNGDSALAETLLTWSGVSAFWVAMAVAP